MTNEQHFKALLSRLHAEVLKPQGWKKEGQNFRLFLPDGLCRIINFQKSAYNDAQLLSFYLNLGVYWEDKPEITNRKFKTYDCFLSIRPGILEKWNIYEGRDMEKLYGQLKLLLETEGAAWFAKAPDRETAIRKYGFRKHFGV